MRFHTETHLCGRYLRNISLTWPICFLLVFAFPQQVLQIDEEKKRFVVTLKPKETMIPDCEELSKAISGPGLLRSLLKEREEMLNKIASFQGLRSIFVTFSIVFSIPVIQGCQIHFGPGAI